MYDVVFISYKEKDCEQRYKILKDKIPFIKRVHGIKGIHYAHKKAAELSQTSMFYVIDGDADLLDDFTFDSEFKNNANVNTDTVYVWQSKNPINDLVYGYGGVKLLPRHTVLNMTDKTTDMTTSLSKHFCLVDCVSNVTAFNTDPFSTWRSAFRECAKLASKIIDRQKSEETDERLKVWTTVGKDRTFGEYALAGARAGMEFGLSDSVDLQLINDFDWLHTKFKEG